MAAPRYLRPDELSRILDRLKLKIDQVQGEARWVHNLGYSKNPTAHAARGSKRAGDPTGATAVGQRVVRDKYRLAVGQIIVAGIALSDAERELKAAVRSADGEADEKAMTGDGIYPAIPNDADKPFLADGEFDEALERRDARQRAGGGFGES